MEQIKRQISQGVVSIEEQADAWHSLFLTLPEVAQVLRFVNSKKCPPFAYPMFVFAAHTGARRSEILRSKVADFDFDANVVIVRERKREGFAGAAALVLYRTITGKPICLLKKPCR